MSASKRVPRRTELQLWVEEREDLGGEARASLEHTPGFVLLTARVDSFGPQQGAYNVRLARPLRG